MRIQITGIFWIRREDYPRYLELCIDRDLLPPTYEKWLYRADQGVKHLERSGMDVLRVTVNLNEFVAWCMAKGLDINADARLEYTNDVAAAQVRARNESKH